MQAVRHTQEIQEQLRYDVLPDQSLILQCCLIKKFNCLIIKMPRFCITLLRPGYGVLCQGTPWHNGKSGTASDTCYLFYSTWKMEITYLAARIPRNLW